ncbi:hypothetical protein G6F57_020443 [Rhizopus arrhizus]|nr:hypothetical protein G6F57_020443 [Rhizopus arrhizus]
MSNQQQQNLDETLQDSPYIPSLEYEEKEEEDHVDEESQYDNGHGEEENEDEDAARQSVRKLLQLCFSTNCEP